MREEGYTDFGLQPPVQRVHPPEGPRDVASLIDRAVARCPNNEALVDATNRYSFGELGRLVENMAALFDDHGVKKGDRIAASLGNDNAIVIAFFAAMRLGAIWVGINKILPADDKHFILSHSGAKLLITDSGITEQLRSLSNPLPELEMIWAIDDKAQDGGWSIALDAQSKRTAPRPEIDPFAPATIMYTSGTTGVPKGVVHSQHNMITVPAALAAHGLQSPNERRGAALPLTITNLIILGPITAFWNFQAFLFAPSIKIDPLIAWMHAERIGPIAFVPTMVYDLLQTDLDLPGYAKLGAGGAPLPQAIRTKFFQRYGYHIQTSYGLTEAPTIVALSHDGIPPEGASGRPAPHLNISIRDIDGKELPQGETGEICFGPMSEGPWAHVYAPPLGYWRDAQKTTALLDGGVVHTGDHGWLDEQGWLSIADRSSELILRGGSNVYPAEVERVLHGHPDVADCALVGKPDLRMGMLTVACIQPAHEEADPEQLIQSLKALAQEKLVRYKVPDEWRIIPAFPRNAMGKVVKPKLRDLIAQEN